MYENKCISIIGFHAFNSHTLSYDLCIVINLYWNVDECNINAQWALNDWQQREY